MHALHQCYTGHTSFLLPLTVPLSPLMHTSHLTTAKIVTRIKTCNVYFHTSYSWASGALGQGAVGFLRNFLMNVKKL